MIRFDKNTQQIGLIFDSTNPNWTGNPEYDRKFILYTERYENDKIDKFGWVSLVDVIRDLGFDVTYDDVCEASDLYTTGWCSKTGKPVKIEYVPIDNKATLNLSNVSSIIFLR